MAARRRLRRARADGVVARRRGRSVRGLDRLLRLFRFRSILSVQCLAERRKWWIERRDHRAEHLRRDRLRHAYGRAFGRPERAIRELHEDLHRCRNRSDLLRGASRRGLQAHHGRLAYRRSFGFPRHLHDDSRFEDRAKAEKGIGSDVDTWRCGGDSGGAVAERTSIRVVPGQGSICMQQDGTEWDPGPRRLVPVQASSGQCGASRTALLRFQAASPLFFRVI